MLCGGVPIAIYPPSRPSQLIDHVQRHVHILKNANAKLLVTDTSSLGRVGKLLQVGFDELKILDAKTDLLTGSGATWKHRESQRRHSNAREYPGKHSRYGGGP